MIFGSAELFSDKLNKHKRYLDLINVIRVIEFDGPGVEEGIILILVTSSEMIFDLELFDFPATSWAVVGFFIHFLPIRSLLF